MDNSAKSRLNWNVYTWKQCHITEINKLATKERDIEFCLISGHIEQITPNHDILDTSKFGTYLPKNTDLYQKAS